MRKIDLKLPKSWVELSDDQLKYAFRLLASELTTAEILTRCFCWWAHLTVIGEDGNGNFAVKFGKEVFEVSALMLAEHLDSLAWLCSLPTYPVRPSKFGKHSALPSNLQSTPFETYIIIDNLYQGYLTTKSDALLDQLASVLYPGVKGVLEPWQRIAVFYWVASLKDYFSRRYPEFFRPASERNAGNLLGSSIPNAEEAMNAQLRALTKGDITKERDVLALDTWRALTELNALAKEYRELNEKLKK